MTTPDRSDRRARAVFWILSAVGAVSLVWRGRPQWFAFDDWTLLIARRHVWETDGLVDFLLLPHNEHMLPGLTLWDIGLASIFGIDSYLPWTLTIVAVFVFTAVVLRRVMAAIDVPPLLAAAWAPVVMVWADFGGALTWAPETVFVLYLALGLAHLLLVVPDTVSHQKAAAGAALSAVAILLHSGAALSSGVIVLVLVAARRWRAAGWSCLPLGGYAVWLVTWGGRPPVANAVLWQGADPATAAGTTGWLPLTRAIAGQGFEFLAGPAGGAVWFAVVAGGIVLVWHSRSTAQGRILAALTGMSVLAVGAIVQSRSNIGSFVVSSPQSRYSVLVVLPLLPVVALELYAIARWITPRLGGDRARARHALVLLATGSFAVAVAVHTTRDTKNTQISFAVRRTMAAIASTPSTRDSRPDVGVMPVKFDLGVGGVWSLIDWGWYDPEPTTDSVALLTTQVRFLVTGGVRRPDDEPVTLRPDDRVEGTDDGDGCVTLIPRAESNRTLIIREPGPAFLLITEGAENVELQARRDDHRSEWNRLTLDPTTSDIRILSDPDVDLSIRLSGPATFCETSIQTTSG